MAEPLYSVINEATGMTRDRATLDSARRLARRLAHETGYDHSVWECDAPGLGYTNTGDYYAGVHGDKLI